MEFSSGVPCTPKYHRNQVWQASGSVQDHSELQSKTMIQKAERGLVPQLSRWNVLPLQGEPGSSTQKTRLCGQQQLGLRWSHLLCTLCFPPYWWQSSCLSLIPG